MKATMNCVFCNADTEHYVGYTGKKCTICGLYMWDFDSWHDVYQHIKRHYNLQRKDVARILNLAPGTVSNYQCTWVGRLVDDLLKWHYKQHSVPTGERHGA